MNSTNTITYYATETPHFWAFIAIAVVVGAIAGFVILIIGLKKVRKK